MYLTNEKPEIIDILFIVVFIIIIYMEHGMVYVDVKRRSLTKL